MLRLRHVDDEVERLRRYIDGMEDSTGPGCVSRGVRRPFPIRLIWPAGPFIVRETHIGGDRPAGMPTRKTFLCAALI